MDYEYPRQRGDAVHSNPTEYNIGHIGEPESLASRILAVFPGRKFKTCCHSDVLHVEFEVPLSAEDKITLDGLVAAQKAVDDWPPA